LLATPSLSSAQSAGVPLRHFSASAGVIPWARLGVPAATPHQAM
jgi:hypothetical protein